MKRSKTRGRKSNPTTKNRATTRAGRSPGIDHGTAELLAQRLAEHGFPLIGLDYPLDVLAAQGRLCVRLCITPDAIEKNLPDEPEADWLKRNQIALREGQRLAELHNARIGSPHAKAVDLVQKADEPEPQPIVDTRPPETPEAADLRRKLAYERMRSALKACGRRVSEVTVNVAVYCRALPDAWTRPAQHAKALDELRVGMAALVELSEQSRVARRAA